MAGHILVVSRTPHLIQRVRGALDSHGFSIAVVPPDADIQEEISFNRFGVVILALGLERRAFVRHVSGSAPGR